MRSGHSQVVVQVFQATSKLLSFDLDQNKTCHRSLPASKLLHRADEQIVCKNLTQEVAVFCAVVHVRPVTVLENACLFCDIICVWQCKVHYLQELTSGD